MQKAGIFQAYAGSNGPDQTANMGSLIKVCLHVVQLFKQCKVDQSVDAILYMSDNADVHVKTETLLLEYEDKFSNRAARVCILMYTYITENPSLLFVNTAL